MFLFPSAGFIQNYFLQINHPVSNSLDPDQDRHSVQTLCKRLLADDIIIRWHAKSYNR